MFTDIYFDIVGGCNAKCPLCVTARTTFGRRIEHISVDRFAAVIDRLHELDLLAPNALVGLYNWGEPILHPDLNGIVAVLNERGLRAGISTNGSRKTDFTTSTKNFEHFTFSVPGWSQASYDKIHGLRFERIRDNIAKTIENMRMTGFNKSFHLSFHVYQFNAFGELHEARDWCEERSILFQPYYAYVNDYQPAKDLRKQKLDPEVMKDFSEKLFLHYVNDLVAAQPKDWACPQWDERLTLTHKGDVLLCCVVPDAHPAANLGSIFDLTREQVIKRKKSNRECTDCLNCGVAYWAHNATHVELPPRPPAPEPVFIAPAALQRRPVIDFFKRFGAKH